MKLFKNTLAIALMVFVLASTLVLPASALSTYWNDRFGTFPEQRVGNFWYGYTSAIQRFLYVDPSTQSDISSSGGIDGYFGSGTQRAVKTFQAQCAADLGCPAIPTSESGKVSTNTWKAIAYMMYEVYPSGYEDWYFRDFYLSRFFTFQMA